MATQKTVSRPGGQSANGRGGGSGRGIPVRPAVPDQSGEENQVGFLIAVISIVVAFLVFLPLMFMVYIDTLKARQETRLEVQKVEKIIKRLEEKEKE
jgi:ABC-type Na+ efflux pump permease subunit